ncbi:hypothetical protein [Solobacterium moorei]|uniref:hypothetical protein n=1 Tax=Solobacterium moorei TaxID=102148 RepID=UPI001CAC7EF7|nr:hypothetical protein [Solobacterium moorei]MBF1026862.1 hypothetical protein [Lachnospiraceae bacterium]
MENKVLEERMNYKCTIAALLIIRKSLGALPVEIFEILATAIKHLVKENLIEYENVGANALCWKFLMNYSFRQDDNNKNIYYIDPFMLDKPQMIVDTTMPDMVFSGMTLQGDSYV